MKTPKKQAEIEDIQAAAAFVDSMAPRADMLGPYPLWHGWALREAYLAGLDAGREELKTERTK